MARDLSFLDEGATGGSRLTGLKDIPTATQDEINAAARKAGVELGLTEAEIYHFAHHTMIAINEMKPQFEDLDSSLDDTAADYIAEAMMMIVQEAGYFEIEMEQLIANREW